MDTNLQLNYNSSFDVKDCNDWRNSSNANFASLGAVGHSLEDRQQHDFYSTDPHSLEIFLDQFNDLHNNIWEPACGMGHLSETLKKYGYKVYSSDLIDRGYGDKTLNFFESKSKDLKLDILTNPPYKYAQEFVEHALEMIADGYYVVMFLKIQFLEGQKRAELYKKYKPKYVYVHSKRQLCYKNGDMINTSISSSATCYCWFVWEKGFNGEPIIRWLY